MDLEKVREYLISRGYSPEELDEAKEPAALKDLGKSLVATFENDNQLGELVTSLIMQINDLAEMVLTLQNEVEVLKK